MIDIIWDKNYSVNIAEIDQQHQKIAVMLDMLFDSIAMGRPKSLLEGILKELTAYAIYHFNTEEALMAQYSYPELEAHKKEHEEFRGKVAEFQNDLQLGKETLPGDVVKFLTHWLADHIMKLDKKYGPFLNARGVF